MSEHCRIIHGDCRAILPTLEEKSVQCCITSPPYWGLRDYGRDGQIGLEPTPADFVEEMVRVFREVRRVLKDDGTLWLNLGDSYARSGGTPGGGNREMLHMEGKQTRMCRIPDGTGLKEKDLVGIPWRVAFALQADGWWLRQDIIWHKPNPMPESVTDRFTKSHEYLFLLSKSARYFFDAESVSEPVTSNSRYKTPDGWDTTKGRGGHGSFHKNGREKGRTEYVCANGDRPETPSTRNKRSVWTIPTKPYKEAHFATFPPDLVKPCVLAGSRPGDTILDPFGGSGTTGMVALELGRKAVLIELNDDYAGLAESRTQVTLGLPFQ